MGCLEWPPASSSDKGIGSSATIYSAGGPVSGFTRGPQLVLTPLPCSGPHPTSIRQDTGKPGGVGWVGEMTNRGRSSESVLRLPLLRRCREEREVCFSARLPRARAGR